MALVKYAGLVLVLLLLVVGPWWPSQAQRVATCLDRGGLAVSRTYETIGIRYTFVSCVDMDGNPV